MLGNLQLQKNLLKININHILVYFSKLTKEEDDVFENINDLDFFFLRLQTVKGRILKWRKSAIIFDEIQYISYFYRPNGDCSWTFYSLYMERL